MHIPSGEFVVSTGEVGLVSSETATKKKRKKKKKGPPKIEQTDPPTRPILELFPEHDYPHGQEIEYPPDKDG